MNANQHGVERRAGPSGSAASGWWIVAARELTDLWIGGRGPVILIVFSVLMGIACYVFATNLELSLFSKKELMYMALQVTMGAGLLISLVMGADCISGERERETFEGLLLTPTSRRQIVVGKFLAAFSPWPLVFAVACAYWAVFSPDQATWVQFVRWGGVVGTLLAAGFTGLGMLVSAWSPTNKASLSFSLVVYLIFLVPSQFRGMAQRGDVGKFVQWANPLAASDEFLEKILVNNRTLHEFGVWLTSPILFPVLLVGLLILYAGPRLRLEGGVARPWRPRHVRIAAVLVTAGLLLSSGPTSLFAAQPAAPTTPQALQVSISVDHKQALAGDKIDYTTVVTNTGAQEASKVVVAMNIVNLSAGDPVDPEDWSPERTQYIEKLPPGKSAELTWQVRAITDGDYLVYMVVIPKPGDAEASSQPVVSRGIHLTVTANVKANPANVLPIALAMPTGLSLGAFALFWARRRQIDTGGSR